MRLLRMCTCNDSKLKMKAMETMTEGGSAGARMVFRMFPEHLSGISAHLTGGSAACRIPHCRTADLSLECLCSLTTVLNGLKVFTMCDLILHSDSHHGFLLGSQTDDLEAAVSYKLGDGDDFPCWVKRPN